jgi:CRISPR-associated protein Csd2
MKKLTYRLDAGRAGGCPILALGIRPALVTNFEAWKAANPVLRTAEPLNIDQAADDEEAESS